jgi:hypothetical protein
MSTRNAIIYVLAGLAVAATLAQFVIDPSSANLASSSIVLLSSLSVLAYIGWTTAIDNYPLSTFAIFGLCATTQLGALLAQTAAWNAIGYSLYDPLYTFGTLAAYQAIALTVHIVYRFFSTPKTGKVRLFRGLLDWAGIYLTPPAGALWLMGSIGLVTFFFSHGEGVPAKIAGAFGFLALAPFLILFYIRDIGEAYCNVVLNRLLLIAYTLIAVFLGLALNTRAIMFSGVLTIGLIYLLSGMRSDAPVTRRALFRLGALAVVVIAISGPLSDLATSMAIAREWRGKVSASAMIRTTYQVWRNPALIAAYRAEGEIASRYRAYDEHYITNPLLARFVTIKYHDNAFHFARAISTPQAKARLRDISIKQAWAGLPDPVLQRLNIGVQKLELANSMGDYLAYLGRGLPLGSHKIGSMFAQGIALFGPLFPFLYAIMCLALFALMDLLSIRTSAAVAPISALGMLEISNFFLQGLSYEGLHGVVYLFMRNFAQMVLIYAVILAAGRLVVRAKPLQPPAPVKLPAWQHSS